VTSDPTEVAEEMLEKGPLNIFHSSNQILQNTGNHCSFPIEGMSDTNMAAA